MSSSSGRTFRPLDAGYEPHPTTSTSDRHRPPQSSRLPTSISMITTSRSTPEVGIQPRPAVEQYLLEGSTLDCSIDQSVDFYVPTPELLGTARWVDHRAEWAIDGRVVARAIEFPVGANAQDMLLVDSAWLSARLRDLDAAMVIGTLSERHALPLDDDDFRHMAFSDVWYVALVTSETDCREVGSLLEVRRRVNEATPEVSAAEDGTAPDEPFDPALI